MLDVTERKVFAITTFVSACLCFAPGQWVSGSALLIASGVLWMRYLRSLPQKTKGTATEQSASQSSAQSSSPSSPSEAASDTPDTSAQAG
jgi:cytoskeletal protein RodZ